MTPKVVKHCCFVFLFSLSSMGEVPIGNLFGKKEERNFEGVNPALRELKGSMVMDEKTKQALERSGKKGVLLSTKEEPGKIYKISITGATKVDPDAVFLRLVSHIGEEFSPVFVAQDIRQIFELGFFYDVLVYKEELPSGAIELRYEPKEYSIVFDTKFEGNKEISSQEIKKRLFDISPGHPANPNILKEAQESIKGLYDEKGFLFATVEYKLIKTPKNVISEKLKEIKETTSLTGELDFLPVVSEDYVDVVFSITEDVKPKITKIAFSGNNFLPSQEIKSKLRTQENQLLSGLTSMGIFRKDYLAIDKLIIEKLLMDNGFLRAKVLEPVVEVILEEKAIHIQYRMEEGPQYLLGDIDIVGDFVESSSVIYELKKENEPNQDLFLTGELRSLINQNKGDIFNRSKLQEDVMEIASLYKDLGYAYANISPVPSIDDQGKIVDFQITIDSGPKVYIERIDIVGSDSSFKIMKSMDEVIRREMKISELDLYSSSLIENSERNIMRLGFFEKVSISESAGSKDNLMVLKVEVSEKPNTGDFKFGGSYSTSEGMMLNCKISEEHLFGRGQSLSASINWSGSRRMFDLSFSDPYAVYVFHEPLIMAGSLYNRELMYEDFLRTATGGEFTLGYSIGSFLSGHSDKWYKKASKLWKPYVPNFGALNFYLTYTVERDLLTDLTANVIYKNLYQSVPFYNTSIRPAIRFDQRDNRMITKSGYFFEHSMEIATSYLGSSLLSTWENSSLKDKKSSGMDSDRKYLKKAAKTSNFIKYHTNLRLYYNLDEWFFMDDVVIKSNLELGLLNDYGKPVVSDNFFLGGANSLRGYPARSISPVAKAGGLNPFAAKKYLKVGGNKELFGSFEAEFPILKMLGVNGVFFFDYGNVFSNKENIFYIGNKVNKNETFNDPLKIHSLTGLFSSAGLGLRWRSPLGLLRFEWGFPLTRRKPNTPGSVLGDDPFEFEFSGGTSF